MSTYDHDATPEHKMTAKGKAEAEKEANARVRACFDEQVTHIRCGDWRGPGNTVITVLSARELHGTVCTCCPKMGAA